MDAMAAHALTVLIYVMAGAPDPITADASTRRYLWSLVVDARYGFAETEQAAFVVVNEGGRRSYVRWPQTGVEHRARWVGPFPPRTVAIVHTHPNWTPEPSILDERAAQKRGIPVYVLTRKRITKTTGGTAQVVMEGDWRPM
jgi:hypothetical protein